MKTQRLRFLLFIDFDYFSCLFQNFRLFFFS